VISTHDAFGYFAAAYDVTIVAPESVSTETERSARDIATIIAQIKKRGFRQSFWNTSAIPD
jgi:zinc/manganese transport system substrate-binding protein